MIQYILSCSFVTQQVCISVHHHVWFANPILPSPSLDFSLMRVHTVQLAPPCQVLVSRAPVFPLPSLVRFFVVLLTDTLLSHPPSLPGFDPPPSPLVKLLGQTHLVFRLAFACE